MNKNTHRTLAEQSLSKAVFWSVSGVLAALLLLHPDLMNSAIAGALKNQTANTELGDITNSATLADNAVFGGVELGSASLAIYYTLTEVVFPIAALLAAGFGLFALIRGFNIVVIGGAFCVAIAAGVFPTLALNVTGFAAAAVF